MLSPQCDALYDQNSTITPSRKTLLAAFKFAIPPCEWLLNLIMGFPAEVTAVTWLLRPETKSYQETLETLLRSK